MNEPIDPDVRINFISLSPVIVILQFLALIDHENNTAGSILSPL